MNARLDLATGSKLAGMIGWSPYEDEAGTLQNMLWNKFRGNAACQWGTDHEPDAQLSTEAWFESLNGTFNPYNVDEIQISAKVTEVGLIRSIAFPFAGMSPDGILTRTFRNVRTKEIRTQRQLLEFKCPYRHRNLQDHWPAYDLYSKAKTPHIPTRKPNNHEQPVPQYYYTQLMWGGLILGKHSMHSILNNPNVETPKLLQFMSQIQAMPTHCGADFIDTEHPILFIVWAPCQRLKSKIQKAQCYHVDREARSKFIRTRHGAIQLTEVEYDHDFATWMMETVYKFRRYQYMPRLVQKQHGVILKGELSVPEDLFSSDEEHEEIKTKKTE